MNKGHVLIAAAVVLLAGVVWFVFGPETCAHYKKRETRAFAEAMVNGGAADAEWYRIRAERPEGCR